MSSNQVAVGFSRGHFQMPRCLTIYLILSYQSQSYLARKSTLGNDKQFGNSQVTRPRTSSSPLNNNNTREKQPTNQTSKPTFAMPFSYSRPDEPSRPLGSNGSFSSFSFSRPSYTNNFPDQARGLVGPRPPPKSPLSVPCPIHKDPGPEKAPIVEFRVAPSPPPPPLLLLPTPPASDFSTPSKQQVKPAQSATIVEDFTFYTSAGSTLLRSVLTAPTPETMRALVRSQESRCILRNMSLADFTDWEEGYLALNKNGKVRYGYDGLTQPMIIKCMPGSCMNHYQYFSYAPAVRGLRTLGLSVYIGFRSQRIKVSSSLPFTLASHLR